MADQLWLKGDDFKNRYIIKGILTTQSPFHLGNGAEVKRDGLYEEVPKSPEYPEGKKPVRINAIDTDWENKPRIPGSSIRGALRGYLLNVFEQFSGTVARCSDIAAYREYEDPKMKEKKQPQQIKFMRDEASHLERLFGTVFTESKIEVQDAILGMSDVTTIKFGDSKHAPYWDKSRLTYIETGVAIDPKTHTAIEKKLYHFEAVPPGVSFGLTITGQNLDPLELGMLIFGLEALNSEIWPLTLGSMSGSGFGRFHFKQGDIHLLKKENLKAWVKQATAADSIKAGYNALDKLGKAEADKLIEAFKNHLKMALEGGGNDTRSL